MKWTCAVLTACCLHAGQTWTVRLEEPTGLYRRDGEVVRVPLAKVGGAKSGYRVVDPRGRESAWQVAGDQLLFAASIIPGETPEYRVFCCSAGDAPNFVSGIQVRQVGMRSVEFGNRFFRAVIDTGVPAITEVYPLSAGPQRSLNLVETTPETVDPADLHQNSFRPMPPIAGVDGPNTGWTTTGASGPITKVEIVESGPLEGRLRLHREGETQEIWWTASGRWFRWRAGRGFRFAAVSALPFLPFDRFVDVPESELWPDVSSTEEPEEHAIGPRPYRKLRSGHGVYYALAENYGALGVIALDAELEWTGIGSRRFLAQKPSGTAEIAITFPEWDGFRTLLNARRENRLVREPLLTRVSAVEGSAPPAVNARAALQRTPKRDSGAASHFIPDALELNGEWELAWCEKGCEKPQSGWRTVRVPGTAHVQWLGSEQSMTREAEWVSGKEWWYRKRIRLPARWAGKRIRLHFEATDYYADTWVNGRHAGRHEGYIDPYEHDITSLVKAGEEAEILVRTWTPVTYYWRSRPWTVKGSYGAVDQKPDEITALGITRPVRIIASDGSAVGDIAVATRLTTDGAEVEIDVEEGNWELTLSPRNFESDERWRVTGTGTRFVIPLRNPRLWWTWDHGRPNLYTLEVRRIGSDGRITDGQSLAVGIREIEKIGWNFYLNRKRLFIRGTNYYYNLFLSEMNRAKYERDIDLLLRMNVNMIRLHCHFSNPEFYDLADERGVLLWQDYLEAWYPEDTAFSRRAARLYDNHIRFVRNHPSVALWATSDEDSLENYRDLTKHLAPRAFLLDPQRRSVIRSTGRYGDSHVYHGWYDGSIWDYGAMQDVFVSELGATSLPNYETLIKFMPDHWPIREHAEEWKWRKLQIPEAMRAWGDPGSMTLKEYIPRTQAYTARLFQIALERARRRKADGAGGILHFHAIDIWPSITMAAIDVDRVPTKTYYTVQRSFEPVLASIEYDRDRWKSGEMLRCLMWAINDRWEPIPDARIEWRIEDASGRAAASGMFPVSMPADSSQKLGAVEWKTEAPGQWILRAAVRDRNSGRISENAYEFEVVP